MKKISLVLSLLFLSIAARAEVTLPKMLSDHMVLQRDRPIHLWGWAGPGESVTATLQSATAGTHADDLGRWSLYLPPQQAGGPYQVTIAGANTITLTDVMIGDVWFASGQSNMELPLMGFPGQAVVTNGQQEIRNANHPELRLLHMSRKAVPYPQQDQGESWTLCTPETAASFSAAAYFFGREIAAREHITIGLIDSTWGGTPAEAWVSMDTIGSDAALMPVFSEWAHTSDDYIDDARRIAREKSEDEAARAAGRPVAEHPWHPDLNSWSPSWLYNGMIAPAVNYPIKGVLWYQGETNSANDRANMYQRIFPALITDWRKQWHQARLPFLYVQISSFTSTPQETWAIVREAQRRTLKLANTAMVVTTDIGTPDNVHPPDKQDVGHRLALAARALAYGEQVEYFGPLYRQATTEGSRLRVWFTHANGLTAKGGALTGFEIAGEDKKFVPATAHVDHSPEGPTPDDPTVLVSSSEVPNPVYVRYDWSNAPQTNLFNAAGLPASPFTSEEDIPQP
ncbi:MAG TPA: sialate O-acetylesterase [Silvibacterium sp.]|nr:sialate O-acetylesterase [Silvibacterium sp.]